MGVWSSGFGVRGGVFGYGFSRFRVSGSGFRGFGFRGLAVPNSGFNVWGWGLGFSMFGISRSWVSRFRGFRGSIFEFRVSATVIRVRGFVFRCFGTGFQVSHWLFRVRGFVVPAFSVGISCFALAFLGFAFWVRDFQVQGLDLGVAGFGFGVIRGSGFRGLGFQVWVWLLGFRIS